MKKVKCEICGEYVLQSDMSKSYRHRCKKCVAEMTRENRHAAKLNKTALHTCEPVVPYGKPVSDVLHMMSEKEFGDIIRLAIQSYGKEKQTMMLFEEMSELQDALCKQARGRDDADHICEEIADVMIMCSQMAQIHGVARVEHWVQLKINRLKERLK